MKSDLEKQILKLKPEDLPCDLMERLKLEPELDESFENLAEHRPVPVSLISRKKSWIWVSAASVTAVAACLLIMFSRNDFVDTPIDNIEQQTSSDSDTTEYLSVVRKQQTLLSSKTLATEELDGQMWELAEEKWMDDTVATCSTMPALVSAKEIRREIVFRPVVFQ